MSPEEVLEQALQAKVKMDEALLNDKAYVCLECGAITDYYKLGMICAKCEAKAELYEY